MGKEFLQEVAAELMDEFVENVCMLEVGSDKTLLSEVAGSSATEVGVGQHTFLGSVNVHGDSMS
jgi:hypothetical protein